MCKPLAPLSPTAKDSHRQNLGSPPERVLMSAGDLLFITGSLVLLCWGGWLFLSKGLSDDLRDSTGLVQVSTTFSALLLSLITNRCSGEQHRQAHKPFSGQ